MKLIPTRKIKYGGNIRRPDIEFEAKDEDCEILCRSFGCRIIETSSVVKSDENITAENAQKTRTRSTSKRSIQVTADNYTASVEESQEVEKSDKNVGAEKPARKTRKKKENE